MTVERVSEDKSIEIIHLNNRKTIENKNDLSLRYLWDNSKCLMLNNNRVLEREVKEWGTKKEKKVEEIMAENDANLVEIQSFRIKKLHESQTG